MVALGERTIPSGQELLAEFIQYGHQKPFEEIVRRYAGMVFNVCYRITKDKHEAEDATQAVFLTLALQAKRGTDIKALGPWLQQVAKRLALDTRRSKKRRQTREERHQVEQTIRRESLLDDALPSADLDELKTVLHEELQKLPSKYRLPLILHYFGGMTRDEMAAELNCKPSTLGVRIFRGREMLAGRLSSRGINITGVMLGTLLGYYVKHAVSETLIASTSHAATAMMAGHDGAGFASAHVIGLTRRATGALVIGKVKVAAIMLLVASTSLGAGAKALGILPQIDVKRIITNQLERIVRPLFQPFSLPMRVDAKTTPAKITVASVSTPWATPLSQLVARTTPPAPVVTKPAATVDSNAGNSGGIVVSLVPSASRSTWTVPATSVNRGVDSSTPASAASADRSSTSSVTVADEIETSTNSYGAGGGAGGIGGLAADDHAIESLPARTSIDSMLRSSDITVTVNDLYVGATTTARISTGLMTSTNPTASPASLIQIPALGGTVTQSSNGEVKGYGIIDRTGTLDINGKVVADGQGIDRTLNLSTFTAVLAANGSVDPQAADAVAAATSTPTAMATVTTASSVPCQRKDGWYAINRGRLTLPLLASSTDSSTLTWGDNPDAAKLSLVNSVRIALQTDGASAASAPDPAMTRLSLLATDRSDAPSLFEISGATIGLWQIGDKESDISAADLTVCYDSVLADDLGASASSLQLWTYGGSSNSWQLVPASSFALDSTDHLVSGYADDFSYFAVSVAPAPGHNLHDLSVSDLVQVSAQAPNNIQSVPEPIGIPLMVLTAGLLGRRRRRQPCAVSNNS